MISDAIPGTKIVLFGASNENINTISAWDMDKNATNQLNISSQLEFTDIQFDEEEKNIAYISSTDSSIYKYDLTANSVVDIYKTDKLVTHISKRLDNKFFFVSDTAWHYSLNVYDCNSHATQNLIKCKGWQLNGKSKYEEINLMPRYEFSNDVKYFAYSEINGYDTTYVLKIVNLNDLDNIDKPLFSRNIGSPRVSCMDFSEDNKFLAVGCYEKWLLINLENQTIREFPMDFAGKIPFYPDDQERRINRIKFTDKNKITYVTSEPSLVEEDISEYTSAPEPSLNKVFNLAAYPNPSEGVFSFEFVPRSSEATRIRVTNLLGETVYERTEFLPASTVSEIAINLEDQFAGVYFISIDNGNERYNSAVVIKK
ncbi:MAG: T9SS type A sorting domain-containing protein [Chloroflexota bacterium]